MSEKNNFRNITEKINYAPSSWQKKNQSPIMRSGKECFLREENQNSTGNESKGILDSCLRLHMFL